MDGLVFVAEAPNGATLTPLALRKALFAFGPLRSCLPRRDGGILVTFSSTPVNLPVSITTNAGVISLRPAHDPAAALKGTIYSSELIGTATKDLLDELGDQVVECQSLKTRAREDGSGRFLLTFPGTVPDFVELSCGIRLSVRAHIPAPLRCRWCFKYTHHHRTCNDIDRLCHRCGQRWHGDICTAPPHCAACNGDHEVTSSDCPVWQRELGIKTISFTEKINFEDARTKYNKLHPPAQLTTPTTTAFPPTTSTSISTAFPSINPPKIAAPTPASHSHSSTATGTYAATLKGTTDAPHPATKPPLVNSSNSPETFDSPAMERLLLAFVHLETAIVAQNNVLMQIVAQNQRLIDHLIPAQPPPTSTTEPAPRAEPPASPEHHPLPSKSPEPPMQQPKRRRSKSSSSTLTNKRDRVESIIQKSADQRAAALEPVVRPPSPPLLNIFDSPN